MKLFRVDTAFMIPIILLITTLLFVLMAAGCGGGGGGSDSATANPNDTDLLDPTLSAAELTLDQALSVEIEDARPALVSNLGPPDAFSKTVDEVEGQLLISEEWSYITLGVRVELVDGGIGIVAPIDPRPEDAAIYPRFYDSDEFDLFMDRADVLELLAGQELTEFDLGEAGITGGLMIMGDQILLGFADNQLVYVETYARVPDPLSELENLYIDYDEEPAEGAQTITAGLQDTSISPYVAAVGDSGNQANTHERASIVESLLPPQAKLVVGFFRIFRSHSRRNRVYRTAHRLQRDYGDYIAKLEEKAIELAGNCKLTTVGRQDNAATLRKIIARLKAEQEIANLLSEAEKKAARSRFIRSVRGEIISALKTSGLGTRVLTKIRETANIDKTIADMQKVVDGVLDPGSIQEKLAKQFEDLGILGQLIGGTVGEDLRLQIARIQKSIPGLGSAQDAALRLQNKLDEARTTLQDLEEAFAQDTAVFSPVQLVNALEELKRVDSDPAVDALATALAKGLEPGFARNLAIANDVLDPAQLGTMRERVRGALLKDRSELLRKRAKELCGRPSGEPVRTELLAGSGVAPVSVSAIRATNEETGFSGHLGPDENPISVCNSMPVDFESMIDQIGTVLEQGDLIDLADIPKCRSHKDEDGDGVNGKKWNGRDCDDADDQNFPGNAEICDDQDNNCDGLADEGLSFDFDLDGHYSKTSCAEPNDDCNDIDDTIHPGAVEIESDGIDQDCDGKDAVPEYRQYHVFKRSGTGYRKRWGGYAQKRIGYDIFYRHIYPRELNQYMIDANKFDEFTDKACWYEDAEGNRSRTSIPICPCATYPDIWTDGSVELIGVFDTWAEMEPYRCDTYQFDPGNIICTQWMVETDPKFWSNINSTCGY